MLYHLEDGPCTESFGIHVAKMAGFPEKVLQVARDKAAELERADYFKDVTVESDEQKAIAMDEEEKEGVEGEEEEEEVEVSGAYETDEKLERRIAALREFSKMDVPNMSEEELQATLQRLFSRDD
jgi:DNA mismatch repair ATPase MutS